MDFLMQQEKNSWHHKLMVKNQQKKKNLREILKFLKIVISKGK